MAFEPKKIDLNAINGNSEYKKGDVLQPSAVNEMVKGILFAQENGGSGTNIEIDSELSLESTNPVQNKVVTEALDGKLNNTAPTTKNYGDGKLLTFKDNHTLAYTSIITGSDKSAPTVLRYSVPMRDQNGVIYGSEPTGDLGLTPKKYVDDKFNGSNKAVSFINYSSMIQSLNELDNTTYNVGQNVMIVTLEVPDLWVSEVLEENTAYTYTSDDDFVTLLSTQGYVQVGYYKLSALETQKVDLTDYVKNTDYATGTKAGIARFSNGLYPHPDGLVGINAASKGDIDRKIAAFFPITPNKLDYAVMKGLTDPIQHTWTDPQKALARATLGITSGTKLYKHIFYFNDTKEAFVIITNFLSDTLYYKYDANLNKGVIQLTELSRVGNHAIMEAYVTPTEIYYSSSPIKSGYITETYEYYDNQIQYWQSGITQIGGLNVQEIFGTTDKTVDLVVEL